MPMIGNCADHSSAMPSSKIFTGWGFFSYKPTDCQPVVNADFSILQSSCEEAQCNNNYADSWKSGAESDYLFGIDKLIGELEVCHDISVKSTMNPGGFP